ncbi:MAG: shikimate dehydrogenase [Beijerinckiaceae bacterium]
MSAHNPVIVTPRFRFVPMIGHPIDQVISPEPMNRWFAARGIEVALVPMDIKPDGIADFFRMVRAWENCAGVSITMPHKQAAFAHADRVSTRAVRAAAVNLMVRLPDGTLEGDMTDGIAFVDAVRARGFEPRGCCFLLIGAGGAGAAVAHAMADAGTAVIHVVEIDHARRESMLATLRQHHPLVATHGAPDGGEHIDIVFNATPLGMRAHDPLPFDLSRLSPTCFVADAVTRPLVTPFIAAARARGHATLTGEEMALAQLPIQLPMWGFDYHAR